MNDKVSDMRKLLDSMMISETEELNELLGMQTIKKAALGKLGSYGKQKLKKIEKTKKLITQLEQTFKKFVAGKSRHPDYTGVELDPNDPDTMRIFLNLIGFSSKDIINIMGIATESTKTITISQQLLREFSGNASATLKKAAKYAVNNNISLGHGSGSSKGRTSSPQPANVAEPTDDGDPGLEKLGKPVAALIKRISPQAAEALDLQLFDGLDIKATQIKALVDKGPNNPLVLLALVGYALMATKIRSTPVRREEPNKSKAEPTEGPTAEPIQQGGVNIK